MWRELFSPIQLYIVPFLSPAQSGYEPSFLSFANTALLSFHKFVEINPFEILYSKNPGIGIKIPTGPCSSTGLQWPGRLWLSPVQDCACEFRTHTLHHFWWIWTLANSQCLLNIAKYFCFRENCKSSEFSKFTKERIEYLENDKLFLYCLFRKGERIARINPPSIRKTIPHQTTAKGSL